MFNILEDEGFKNIQKEYFDSFMALTTAGLSDCYSCKYAVFFRDEAGDLVVCHCVKGCCYCQPCKCHFYECVSDADVLLLRLFKRPSYETEDYELVFKKRGNQYDRKN